jgi:hypothetical protein
MKVLLPATLLVGLIAATGFPAATKPTPAPIKPAAAVPNALQEFTDRLQRSRDAYAAIKDYTAGIYMRERIDDELTPAARGAFKFRKPFAVYLRWDEGANKGLEAMYVRGKYDDKVVAHPAGLLGLKTYWLDPKGALAMRGSRHPITEAGIGNMLEILDANRRRAVAENRASARRLPEQPNPGPAGPRYELLVAGKPSNAFYCRRAVVTFDPKTHLVAAAQIYDWSDALIEDYRYSNLRLDVGLTDRDFDVENPAYGF